MKKPIPQQGQQQDRQHPRHPRRGNLSNRNAYLVLWVAVLGFVGYRVQVSFAHFRNVQREFHAVTNGLPKSWALTKFGKPTVHEGKCGVVIHATAGCATEYVYGHPMTPLIPEYYVIEFGSNGLVLSSQHLASPK